MCALPLLLLGLAAQEPPRFVPETLGPVEIGYGVALGDVDGDGDLDVLLADKRAFVWYRNPDWQRFVMVEDLTRHDNVCIAARDLDGDGKVEVAVGASWNPGDTETSGSVHYLVPPADRTRRWTPVELPNEPVVHRMRWVALAPERFALVVAPLHGRGNVNGQGAGARLLAYERPDDVREAWTTTVVDDTLHLAHNFDVVQWDEATPAEELLYIGREGVLLLSFDGEGWRRQLLEGIDGGGEVRMGRGADGSRFIATISPLHGPRLALHRRVGARWEREVLDESFNGGHAIAVADLWGDGGDEVVAGWRLKNGDGEVGLKLYGRGEDGAWRGTWLDRDGMATEDARIADLDGDGHPDVVAAGRATRNLKVYWNRAPE